MVEIANTTIVNNNSYDPATTCCTGIGGGVSITNNSTPFKITNSTIVNNHASWGGGGIAGGAGILSNTIVANNTADNGGHGWNIIQNCTNTFTDGGNNLQYPAKNPNDGNDKNCVASPTIAQPQLGPLANNGGPTQTMALLPGSPAINTGNNATCAASPVNNKDQRGVPRPSGANCDIGAFEVAPRPTISKAFAPTFIAPGAQATLTFTLTNPNAGPLTGLTFSDSFPAGLVVANPAGITNSCSTPGTVVATPGSGAVSVSGVGIATVGSCTISLKVTSATANLYPNTTGVLSSFEMGAGTASNTANLLVAVQVYDSSPARPNGTLMMGAAAVGQPRNANLTISNLGNPATTLKITGAAFSTGNAADFAITAPANFPVNIAGGSSQNLGLRCTPSALGLRTTQLTVTSDDPNLPSAAYTLKCYGSNLIVTASTDNGNGTPGGALSQMLQQATSGQAIIFDPAVTAITVNGALPALQSGVIIDAGCGASGPKVTLDGNHNNFDGLTLGGNNFIIGLKIINFGDNATHNTRQLNLNNTKGNQFSCFVVHEP